MELSVAATFGHHIDKGFYMLWIVLGITLFLISLNLILYVKARDLKNQNDYLNFLHEIEAQKNILEDLQLATTSQLISELRTRQAGQVLILSYSQGGTLIQSCNMTVGERLFMLGKAYDMAKEEYASKNNQN